MQFWPGQIDMTRDLLPVIAKPPQHPHIRFISGLRGNPVGCFLRQLRARGMLLGEADDDYAKYFNYFSNGREFRAARPPSAR